MSIPSLIIETKLPNDTRCRIEFVCEGEHPSDLAHGDLRAIVFSDLAVLKDFDCDDVHKAARQIVFDGLNGDREWMRDLVDIDFLVGWIMRHREEAALRAHED